ncbi:RraA family protein [Hyphomonas sp.]|uniref:RraA family protein n=1 Tax=Hyphomonas sp. TaxID=87 RepID=UPI003564DDB8
MNSGLLIDRLRALDSATIADVMTAMGLHGQVLSPALRPTNTATARCAGHAVCARGSNDPDGPGIASFRLDNAVTSGCIVLIDTNGCETGAIVGGNMVTSMMGLGAAGFIIDGGIRDAQELSACSAPVYRRYDTPISAHGRWKYTSVGEAITLPGVWQPVQVHPGDLVLTDSDGIVVLPKAHAESIIGYAERHIQSEDAIGKAIRNGESRETATKNNPRLTYVVPLTDLASAPNE